MATHPGFLPGKSPGQRSLVGYGSRGHRVRQRSVLRPFQAVAGGEGVVAGAL